MNDGTKGEVDAGRRMIIGSKHPRILTAEGREIVRPGYSTWSHMAMGSGGQLKKQRAKRCSPQNGDHLNHMKPGIGNSQTQSRDKGTEVVVDLKVPRPGSELNDSTRCAG
jgi:hypothetical protein